MIVSKCSSHFHGSISHTSDEWLWLWGLVRKHHYLIVQNIHPSNITDLSQSLTSQIILSSPRAVFGTSQRNLLIPVGVETSWPPYKFSTTTVNWVSVRKEVGTDFWLQIVRKTLAFSVVLWPLLFV